MALLSKDQLANARVGDSFRNALGEVVYYHGPSGGWTPYAPSGGSGAPAQPYTPPPATGAVQNNLVFNGTNWKNTATQQAPVSSAPKGQYGTARAQSTYADYYDQYIKQGYDHATAHRVARAATDDMVKQFPELYGSGANATTAYAQPSAAAPTNSLTQPSGGPTRSLMIVDGASGGITIPAGMEYAYTMPGYDKAIADIRAKNPGMDEAGAQRYISTFGYNSSAPSQMDYAYTLNPTQTRDPIFDQQYVMADGSLMDMNKMPDVLAADKALADGKLAEQATLKTQRQGYALDIAKQYFPNDQKAQAAFVTEYLNGLNSNIRDIQEVIRVAKSAGDRWVNDPFRFITEHIDNAINGDPTGILAGAAATGVKVGMTFGPGVTPGSSGGMSAQDINTQADKAIAGQVASQPQMQMPTNGPNPAAGFGAHPDEVYPTNRVGYTPIDLTGALNRDDAKIGPGSKILPGAAQAVDSLPDPTAVGDINPSGAPAGAPGATGTVGGTSGVTPTSPGTGGTTTDTTGGTNSTVTGTGTTTPTVGWSPDGAFWAQLAAAVASGGLSLAAAEKIAQTQRDAATTQSTAMDNALKVQQDQFKTQQNNIAPWLTAGGKALTELENFDANNPSFTFTNDDPSYTFRLKEGLDALQNSAAARGGLLSGNSMKAITDYGQKAASQEYQNAFNRFQTTQGQKLNRLQSLAGVGQTAVQQANTTSQNYANNAGGLMTGSANAQAQGMTGAADARATGWMGAGNSFINGLNNYYANQSNQQMANALMSLFK